MGKLSPANLKKTIYYFKRNGMRNTWYAARERLLAQDDYRYEAPSQETLARQRQQAGQSVTFSIVVPAYHTNAVYLRELLDSVMAQSYPFWELLLADATEDDSVKRQVEQARAAGEAGERIRYHKLPRNAGISGNTNAALPLAKGEYIGLLDHDDLLTDRKSVV